MAERLRPPRLADVLEPLADATLDDDTVLDGVDIHDVDLGGAGSSLVVDRLELRGCRLRSVTLTGRTLTATRWQNCVVERSELSGALLERAAWTRVDVDDSRLAGIVLSGADLAAVRFRRCRLDGAVFRMANLPSAWFEDCELQGADFTGADVRLARFDRCRMAGADVTQARMKGADLRGSDVTGLVGGRALAGVRIDAAQLTPMALNVLGALGITIEDPDSDRT